jgi:nickel-dependent lactate racemase
MAGFSGGRKSVCPGLSSLDTIRLFHGYTFLSNPHAQNAVLSGNPCHEESLSVARAVGVDFSLNVVLNRSRDVIAAFAGSLVAAHDAACTFAASGSVQTVTAPADIAVVSSGGYPLDATFYQCVKGFVSCLAALKPNGTIIAFGSCAEGIGSPEYTHTMQKYANDDWRLFLKDIEDPSNFTKDQWQFQMHCKALEKVGISRLHFISSGLTNTDLNSLSVNGHSVDEKNLENEIHNLLSKLYNNGMRIAVFPEGPYCVPTVSQ